MSTGITACVSLLKRTNSEESMWHAGFCALHQLPKCKDHQMVHILSPTASSWLAPGSPCFSPLWRSQMPGISWNKSQKTSWTGFKYTDEYRVSWVLDFFFFFNSLKLRFWWSQILLSWWPERRNENGLMSRVFKKTDQEHLMKFN